MTLELVSVIITTYKREPDLVVRAVKSVLNQSYGNIELIVVDDSPSDYELRDSVKLAVLGLDNKIIYLPHRENLGACAARNTGIAAAKGTFIAFLDDDDEWLPEKIEMQIRLFEDDEVALVYCGATVYNDLDKTSTVRHTKFMKGFVFDELIVNNFIGSTSFPLIRKKYLEEIGGFDVMMRSAQDYDVWLRLAKNYKIEFVEEPLVVYHVHPGERISSNPKNRIAGQERIIEKHADYFMKHRKASWLRHIKISVEYAKDQKLLKAIKIWLKEASKCPFMVKDNLYYLYKVLSGYMEYRNINKRFVKL